MFVVVKWIKQLARDIYPNFPDVAKICLNFEVTVILINNINRRKAAVLFRQQANLKSDVAPWALL